MKKEQKIFHQDSGDIKRPTEEIALARITINEKQKRHDRNISRLTGFWHGKFWINGKPQR